MAVIDRDRYTVKAGDTDPPLEVVLRDGRRRPIPLNEATTVRFLMRAHGRRGDPLVDGECEVVDEDGGRVSYQWQAGDTDTPDIYAAEWEITWTGGTKRTVPNDGYVVIEIQPDLG